MHAKWAIAQLQDEANEGESLGAYINALQEALCELNEQISMGKHPAE